MEMNSETRTQECIVHVSTPIWVITEVVAQKNYTLLLTFANGEKRLYDANPLLEKPIYAPLKNLSFFMNVQIAGDSIAWNDELDIAPEHLYESSILIKKNS